LDDCPNTSLTIKAMKEMERNLLINTCARICCYAQEHSRDCLPPFRDKYTFESTSYIVACFISQSPVSDCNDVEWDIVLDDLTSETKGLQEWQEIISRLVEVYA